MPNCAQLGTEKESRPQKESKTRSWRSLSANLIVVLGGRPVNSTVLAIAPKAYACRLLLSLRLCTHSVSNDSLQTFHDLDIARKAGMGLSSTAAWVRPSSRRGVRAVKSAKRNRTAKRFVPFALINTRSLS